MVCIDNDSELHLSLDHLRAFSPFRLIVFLLFSKLDFMSSNLRQLITVS
jgi:hypothetical protein